LLQPGRV